MDGSTTQFQHLAGEQIKLLTALEAHARRTNELLYAMLNREQRQGFDASPAAEVPAL
ncbi:hypothetical protein [Nevskia soli]|uniref:hypothetical protein n=1 Tax=Nevskia soli TaxID=418856 RepID=UPI0012FA9192|nr:hypothetical protein [Nevskia soli]